ncbi:RNA polymerase sigma factor [Melioribacteraceae bacterium 4301-Me]|uniref:RNA polymerase sigma factor n=1 Tax=Pyranulibacter aquaticus TaxID=3163344 RepID=UPI0035974714
MKGDSTAFSPLIKLYRRQLFSYFLKLCGNKTAAEDLFQETLIKIWKAMPKYKEENKFSSWLFTIAHNTAVDYLRKFNHKNSHFVDVEIENCGHLTNPFAELVAAETKEIISRYIEKLPLKQREVFLLRQNCGMTFREIAELTGEPLNTVLSHMNYALKKIRTVLRKNDEQ